MAQAHGHALRAWHGHLGTGRMGSFGGAQPGARGQAYCEGGTLAWANTGHLWHVGHLT
jgi:hypothetical protein